MDTWSVTAMKAAEFHQLLFFLSQLHEQIKEAVMKIFGKGMLKQEVDKATMPALKDKEDKKQLVTSLFEDLWPMERSILITQKQVGNSLNVRK